MTENTAAPAFKRLHVIINPAAGQDHPFLQIFNRSFQEAGIDWDLFITKKAGDAERLAREAVEAGADVVAAYGGDGTVAEVASGLRGSDVPLAIFPGGTANVMSIELGIPADIAGAVSLLCGKGELRPVDMGQLGDRVFMLRATVGFTAEMTKGAEREEKNRLGNLAYFLSAFRALPEAKPALYKLQLDDKTEEVEGMICVVANSGSLGLPGVSFTPLMNVSDGMLDVIVIQAVNLGSLLSVAASAAGLAQPLHHWQAKQVTVTADPAQNVECDGEIIEPTPFTVKILPQAIRVIVPKVEAK